MKSLDKHKPKELDRTTEISIGELNRNKLVDEITSKELSKPKELEWEKVAFLFHNIYEGLAPKFGYETRKDTKAFDTKSQNGQLMIATCKAVVSHFLTQQRTELLEEIKNMPIEVVGNSQATVNQIIRLLNKKDEN